MQALETWNDTGRTFYLSITREFDMTMLNKEEIAQALSEVSETGGARLTGDDFYTRKARGAEWVYRGEVWDIDSAEALILTGQVNYYV